MSSGMVRSFGGITNLNKNEARVGKGLAENAYLFLARGRPPDHSGRKRVDTGPDVLTAQNTERGEKVNETL